jgi:ATP synthase I subunit
MNDTDAFYAQAERRIERLVLVLGVLLTVGLLIFGKVRLAGGVLAGSALGWLNFRWLKQTLAALAAKGNADAGEQAQVPKSLWFKVIGRYVLVLGLLCAILLFSFVPGSAVLGGFFCLVAAVLIEIAYQLARGLAAQD